VCLDREAGAGGGAAEGVADAAAGVEVREPLEG